MSELRARPNTKLGHRAGYPNNISGHDIRAEALVKADHHGYSVDERMKFGAHTNPRTFFNDYASSTSTVDGVAIIYDNLPLRTDHVELFRGWSLRRHPRLWQSLPAKLKFDLASTPEFIALDDEISVLGERIKNPASAEQSVNYQARRQELYKQKHNVMVTILKEWQESLPRAMVPGQSTDNTGYSVDYHWSLFDRVCHLMPERRRLACSLFLPAPPRSKEGQQTLDDMVALGRRTKVVGDTPGLETHNGCCPVADCSLNLDELSANQKWKHVYQCCRMNLLRQYDYAEFCWLGCFRWFTAMEEWEQHCQDHLTAPERLPVQWGLLTFRGTLAAPGICGWCLSSTKMIGRDRLKQYLNLVHFENHVEDHLIKEQGNEIIMCPDWRGQCASSVFASAQDLRYHLQDTHCIPMPTKLMKNDHAVKGKALQTPAGRKRRVPVNENPQKSLESSAKQTDCSFSVLTPNSFIDGPTTFASSGEGVSHRKRRRVVYCRGDTPGTVPSFMLSSSNQEEKNFPFSGESHGREQQGPWGGDN